jgi:hypothetical protein
MKETVMKTQLLLLGAVAALVASPALAHHSGAMFDSNKELTLQGTVKEFQWTNPHSWIQLNVADPAGKVTEWSLEYGGVSQLYKRGVRASSLKAGDKVTIVVNPLKNGNAGGMVKSVIGPDGKKLGEQAQG